MSWELVVLVVVLYDYGLVQIAVKKIGAAEGSRARKLVWQYTFAAFLALVTALVFGQLEVSREFMIVGAIGIANAFACYCMWRAYDISMARTSVLNSLDDLIAMGLGYAFLSELDVLTPVLAAGIVVSIVCAIVFFSISSQNKSADDKPPRQLFGWVLGYSLIWGVAIFSIRAFALEGLHMLTYVAAWYGGAWFGALFMRFALAVRGEIGPPLSHIQKAEVLLLAVAIWISLMTHFWARELAPLTVVQPIFLVAEMSIPAIIGLTLFREARTMSKKEIVTIACGLIGVALIAIGF